MTRSIVEMQHQVLACWYAWPLHLSVCAATMVDQPLWSTSPLTSISLSLRAGTTLVRRATFRPTSTMYATVTCMHV